MGFGVSGAYSDFGVAVKGRGSPKSPGKRLPVETAWIDVAGRSEPVIWVRP
jgi:hypothetical protein